MATNNTATNMTETATDESFDAQTIKAPVQKAASLPVMPVTPSTPNIEATPFSTSEGELSLNAILPQLTSIALSECRRLHISSPALVSAGLVYAANFAQDRPLFDEVFKKAGFDVTAFDDMRKRSIAYWHLCLVARQNQSAPLKELVAEAKPLRLKMVRAATYLWGEDPKLGEVVSDIRNGQAYINQADDLGALARLFMDNWSTAEGRCDITKEEVLKARNFGEKLLESLCRSKVDEITEAKEIRLKAGEYLLRGIDKIRAAGAFVFADEEQLAGRYPSLSVMKKKRSGGTVESEEEESEEVEESGDGLDEIEVSVPVVTAPDTALPASQPVSVPQTSIIAP